MYHNLVKEILLPFLPFLLVIFFITGCDMTTNVSPQYPIPERALVRSVKNLISVQPVSRTFHADRDRELRRKKEEYLLK